eukprot:c53430_g1_i1 orf=282-899(+)
MDRFQASGYFLFAFFLVCLLGCLNNAYAAQHSVGGAAGWSIPAIVNVNYSSWAQRNSFHVGDTLVFKYDTTFHDVDQVTKANYITCNDTNPEAHYADGNTSIQLNTPGSYYFICGVPGHCSAGQKVEVLIKAPTNASAPTLSPAPASEPEETPSAVPSSAASEAQGTPASEPSSSVAVAGDASEIVSCTSCMACLMLIICAVFSQ